MVMVYERYNGDENDKGTMKCASEAVKRSDWDIDGKGTCTADSEDEVMSKHLCIETYRF